MEPAPDGAKTGHPSHEAAARPGAERGLRFAAR
jgi:hypothetical protein